jgi:leucyl/phenylalanyl-tRNA--protein transferase
VKPFTVEDLLNCYERGVFPMADSREDDGIFLIDPAERGVLPLGGFHVPKRLARTVRSDLYQVRVDTAFEAVVEACAAARPDRPETWINRPIQTLYRELFLRGYGHSVECWLGPRLVGGLYGVAVGGAFFGESMFSHERDASKVALVHLVARLKVGHFHLLDTQFLTEHLSQFGAVAVPRAAYRTRLRTALERHGDFYLLPAAGAGGSVLQAISQAS